MKEAEADPTAGLAASERDGDLGELLAFGRFVYRRAGRRAPAALTLQILSGLMEGVSILLLIPALTLVGMSEQGAVLTVPDFGWLGDLLGGTQIGLPLVLSGIVSLITLSALMNRLKTILVADAILRVINDLRLDLTQAIANAEWQAVAAHREAELSHLLTGDADRVQAAAITLLNMAQMVIMLSFYLAASLLISPAMTVVAAGAAGILLVVMRPVRQRAAWVGREATRHRQHQYRTVGEFLSGMKLIKVLNVTECSIDRLRATLDQMRANVLGFSRLSSFAAMAFQILSALSLAIFVYLAITVWDTSGPRLIVLLFVFMRIVPRIQGLEAMRHQALQNIPAFHAIRDMQQILAAYPEASFAEPLPQMARDLRCEEISFAYASGGGSVLSAVSLEIRFGDITAIIGPSGSGKSTLSDILTGLLAPTSGRLLVDGVPLSRNQRRAWRDQVAVVQQDIFLLHDTVAANLRLAAPQADKVALWDALDQAQAADFVRRLPQGLETLLGDRGAWLSGGERQRLALARALLRRPRLLVLDEATSALDSDNQRLIARTITRMKGTMTVVTIAHRPSMIDFADRVVALEHGRVAERGSFADLATDPASRLSRMLASESAATSAAG